MRRPLFTLLAGIGFLFTLWFLSNQQGEAPPVRFFLWSGLSFMAVWSGVEFVRRFMARRVAQLNEAVRAAGLDKEPGMVESDSEAQNAGNGSGATEAGGLGAVVLLALGVGLFAPGQGLAATPEISPFGEGGSEEFIASVGVARSLATPVPWSAAGHRLVCRIAWNLLSAEVQAEVAEVLGPGATGTEFTDGCVWADQIRAQLSAAPPELEHLARYTPAHYVNFEPGLARVTRDGCTQGEGLEQTPCVIDAIDEMVGILEGAPSPLTKGEALRFLIHFVGDVHQPLHSGYGDDLGGNRVGVSVMGEERNLHWVWDTFFLEHDGEPWEDRADRLLESLTAAEKEAWETEDPLVWAQESYVLVESRVYPEAERSDWYIGQEYFDRNILAVERRLLAAGVRLAFLLNRVFG